MLRTSIKIKLKNPKNIIKDADAQYDIYKLRKEPEVLEETIEYILQNHTHNIQNWNDLTAKLENALISKSPKVKNKQNRNNGPQETLRKQEKDTNYKIYGDILNINRNMNLGILIKYMEIWGNNTKK